MCERKAETIYCSDLNLLFGEICIDTTKYKCLCLFIHYNFPLWLHKERKGSGKVENMKADTIIGMSPLYDGRNMVIPRQ